jgi:hypothetical protein
VNPLNVYRDLSARARRLRPHMSPSRRKWMLSPRFSRMVLTAVGVGWGLLVMSGLGAMHAYESAPGAVGLRATRWPHGSPIHPDPHRANLVLIAHPRCPCTRATFDELERIAAGSRNSVAIHVLFFKPGGEAGGWGETELHRRAAAIPGATVLDDPDGSEGLRFGAATSGHALLYDQAGQLLFSGGLTAARGRAGTNRASEAVVDLLSGARAAAVAPVFGCPIREAPVISSNN